MNPTLKAGPMSETGLFDALYARVSTTSQKLASQIPDLERWARAYSDHFEWYKDVQSGKDMSRLAIDAILDDVRGGKVRRLVVWRLDRLGRTASGLLRLFDELKLHKVQFISLREGIDLGTISGRLMAGVLASMAEFELESIRERIQAGQAAARAEGKTWGGSQKGWRWKVTDEQAELCKRLHDEGQGVSAISRATGLARNTVYRLIGFTPKRRRRRPKE